MTGIYFFPIKLCMVFKKFSDFPSNCIKQSEYFNVCIYVLIISFFICVFCGGKTMWLLSMFSLFGFGLFRFLNNFYALSLTQHPFCYLKFHLQKYPFNLNNNYVLSPNLVKSQQSFLHKVESVIHICMTNSFCYCY